METRSYQYRSILDFSSGGYPGEEYGPQGATTPWITTNAMSGSRTSVYYYRDSNVSQNSNSSMVEVTVKDTWTASIADDNTLNIVADTNIVSIVRGSIQGNPNLTNSTRRNIYIRRDKDSPVLASWTNLNIGKAEVISSGVDLPSYFFSLAPGEDAERSTLYCFNCATGHENDPLPSDYVDAMYMGVQFRNILPKDYRPGASWNNGWLSHNRSTGACNIWNGSKWVEMRTTGAPTAQGDPPLIRKDNGWYNMAKIGSGG